MHHRVFCTLLILTLLLNAYARADEVEHEPTGLRLLFPADWVVKTGEDQMLIAESPDQTVKLLVLRLDHRDMKDALAEFADMMAEKVGELEVEGAPEHGALQGMVMARLRGKGVIEETDILWRALLLDAGQNLMLALAYGPPPDLHKHEPTISRILGTIRRPS